jgi:3-deoxy-manno-octulosonate cytidylyltransferase (CMP-KDO synthetase)
MKTVALIPARYAATRFPGKLMERLAGKSIILTTYENTVATGLFDQVMVVTDSSIIFNEIVDNKGAAVMSKASHESGSDRIVEAAKDITADVVVNIQGDEPFVNTKPLRELIAVFENPTGDVKVASLMHTIKEEALIKDPNSVKVVVDKDCNALFFSRSVIPYLRDKKITPVYYKHIGIYAFRKEVLMNFPKLPVTPLEATEKLEQLRFLENGIKIRMVKTRESPISIDTPEDLVRAKKWLDSKEKK